MNKINAMKWGGLLGALFTGGTLIAERQYTEGFGVILAALSSAGVLKGGE